MFAKLLPFIKKGKWMKLNLLISLKSISSKCLKRFLMALTIITFELIENTKSEQSNWQSEIDRKTVKKKWIKMKINKAPIKHLSRPLASPQTRLYNITKFLLFYLNYNSLYERKINKLSVKEKERRSRKENKKKR